MRTTAFLCTLLFTLTIGLASRAWAQVPIPAGTDIQSIVDQYPPGTTFVLGSVGVHTMQSVNPRDGDRFEGENGLAVMSGAKSLSEAAWTYTTCSGRDCWYVTGQEQEGRVTFGGQIFDGSDNDPDGPDYVDLEGVPNLGQFTIAMFYTPASRPAGGTIDVLGTYGEQGVPDVSQPWVAFTPMLYVNPEGHLVGLVYEGGFIGVGSDAPLEIGVTYHIALTCDGSALRLYVNFALQGAGAPAACPVTGFADPVFRTGARVEFGPSERVHGTLFDVAIWADDLDAGQIWQLATRQRFPDQFSAALVGYASLTRDPLGHAELGGPLVRTGTESVAQSNCVLDPAWWPYTRYPRCNYPEDLWFDDEIKRHVASIDEVDTDTWHFDYELDRIYVGENPFGRNVETSVTAYAFGGATNVVLQDLLIEKYAAPTQIGVAVALGPGSTLLSSEVRHNHYAGVYNEGSPTQDSTSQENNVHHNGAFGFIGAGWNIHIIGNEVAFNNTAGYNPFWGAGGSKWVYTEGLVVQGNWSHSNGGPGFWTDINNHGCLYVGNEIQFNARQGIFHEISYDCVIRNNNVIWNGFAYCGMFAGYIEGAGIQVDASRNVEVHDNVLLDNCHGIGAVQQNRGAGNMGPWVISNLHVHDNTVTMSSGFNGLIVAADVADPTSYFTSKDNRWQRNSYFFANVAELAFKWNFPGVDLAFSDWQNQCQWVFGTTLVCQDADGSVAPR